MNRTFYIVSFTLLALLSLAFGYFLGGGKYAPGNAKPKTSNHSVIETVLWLQNLVDELPSVEGECLDISYDANSNSVMVMKSNGWVSIPDCSVFKVDAFSDSKVQLDVSIHFNEITPGNMLTIMENLSLYYGKNGIQQEACELKFEIK